MLQWLYCEGEKTQVQMPKLNRSKFSFWKQKSSIQWLDV